MGFRKRQRQDAQASSVNIFEVVSKRKSVPVSAREVSGLAQTGQGIDAAAHWRENFSTTRMLRFPGLKDHFLTASRAALLRSGSCELATAAVLTLPSGPISTRNAIVPVAPLLRSVSG